MSNVGLERLALVLGLVLLPGAVAAEDGPWRPCPLVYFLLLDQAEQRLDGAGSARGLPASLVWSGLDDLYVGFFALGRGILELDLDFEAAGSSILLFLLLSE